MFLELAAVLAPTADIFVDVHASQCASGVGTAADPVCSIQAALAIAAPGDTIRIAPGTYVESLVVNLDVDLVGDAGSALTIVRAVSGDRVITVPSAVTLNVEGLTLTEGTQTSSPGGGMHVMGSVVLQNSTISNNAVTHANGGGLYVGPGASARLEGCLVIGNKARSTYDPFGGGIAVNQGTLGIYDSTITDNYTGRFMFENFCLFTGGGGGVSSFDSDLVISRSTISGNSSGCEGGGLRVNHPSGLAAQISNSTISGNWAEYGGGVYADRIQFEHVTIAHNRTWDAYGYTYNGGDHPGVRVFGMSSGNTAKSCLITDNFHGGIVGPTLDAEDVSGFLSSLGDNVIGATIGSSFIDGVAGDQVGTRANPLSGQLAPLADNGGPTPTHALRLGSPAIDRGALDSSFATDQRGVARPFGLRVDVGAFEHRIDDVSFCNGDGGDQLGCTSCPCANESPVGTIGGCLNSSGRGAMLNASGSPSVSLPAMSSEDLEFSAQDLPASSFALLLSGSSLAPEFATNPCFGQGSGVQASAFDGLRCAITGLRRHGTRSADSNGAIGLTNEPWGGTGPPHVGIAVAFGGFAAGTTRYFQLIHREFALAVCMRGLNTSQAIEVTFLP